MKHYTEIVPFDLAKKLKNGGYPQDLYTPFAYNDGGELIEWIGKSTLTAPSYADVFDWLMLQGESIEVCLDGYYTKQGGKLELHSWGYRLWHFYHHLDESGETNPCWDDRLFEVGEIGSWEDAANKAIEKALELLN